MSQRPGYPASARTVDWAAVHERVKRLGERLDASVARSAEETRRILAARAAAFARAPAGAARAMGLPLVVFCAGSERYGIEPGFVRAVVRTPPITALPGAPPFVRGMVAARGRIVAAVELQALWSGSVAPAPAARLLMLEQGDVCLGLLVDVVEGVSRIAGDLRAPAGGNADTRCVRGLADEGLVVLEGARLLMDPRLARIGRGGI